MIPNWTWDQLTQEALRLKPAMEVTTASYIGQDPKTDLAWFKVSGTRSIDIEGEDAGLFAISTETKVVEDWVMVQLSSSHAIDEGQSEAA